MSWFLLGAPWDSSGSGRGEQQAPAALRAAGLAKLVAVDLGDAATIITGTHRDEATGVRALPQTVAAARNLAEALAAATKAHPNHRPLIVGGDCSLLLGVFPYLRAQFGEVGLWMLDGHPDYLDGHSSDTGETADMELALLIEGTPPLLEAGNVVLIGHRTDDLDPESAAEVARLPADMVTIPAGEVLAGPGEAGRRAAAGRRTPMWLHIDLDVLDPSALSAVTYPQAGGPDFAQLAELLEPLTEVVGVSVADFRPDLDPDGTAAARIVGLLSRFCAD